MGDFTGKNCDTAILCADTVNPPCANSALCTDAGDYLTFICTCTAGFTGALCDQAVACAASPCGANGVCGDLADDTFACTCNAGYTGTLCETTIKCETPTNPCDNLGTCVDFADFSDYTCVCVDGFYGTDCDQVQPCNPNSCLNGAACENTPLLDAFGAQIQAFTCYCDGNYEGIVCGDLPMCASGPCENNGGCIDDSDFAGYTCVCPSSYTGANLLGNCEN